MKKWIWLLALPLLLTGCGKQDGLCGSFDRGGVMFHFDGESLTVLGERMPYEEEDGKLRLVRRRGEYPFVCPFVLDEEAGILYLNGLPYYRVKRGA